jgi:hypothetical protein
MNIMMSNMVLDMGATSVISDSSLCLRIADRFHDGWSDQFCYSTENHSCVLARICVRELRIQTLASCGDVLPDTHFGCTLNALGDTWDAS